ncbi:DUF4145 domain-containing protein [Streptomyces sp. NPDC003757]
MTGISRVCGWCNDRCHMTRWGDYVVLTGGGLDSSPIQLVFKCDGCGRLSLATGHRKSDVWDNEGKLFIDPAAAWLPHQVGRKEFEDVPPVIGGMAVEAHRCLTIRANRAAVALARAVVEATAKSKGITSGSLEKKIDKLFDQRFIREHVKDAAHEVRFGGNEVAHGDLVAAPMDHDTATEILGLMDEILEEVFQSPARVERRRQQRLAREQERKAGAWPTQAVPAHTASEGNAPADAE